MIKYVAAGIAATIVLIVGVSGNVHAQTNKQSSPKSGIYAALGDSVAAGAGLSQDAVKPCDRSTESYPYKVAQQTKLQLIHVACSGATAGDLVTRQGVQGPNPAAQLDTAFSKGVPDLITITAGANDVQWPYFIYQCYQSNCATQTNDTLAKSLMAAMQTKLSYSLGEIQRRSNGDTPQVIVTGYYNPVSNYCKGKQSYATNDEIKFLNKQRDALNKSIRDTIKQYKFASYASANFDQHGLCAKQPWSQGLSDRAPLHPTTRGQQEIAKSVLSVVKR